MHVHADHGACAGYLLCVMEAPAVFDIDDSGTVVVTDPQPGEGARRTVEAAVAACPARALRLSE